VWGTPGGWQARPRWRTVGGVVPPPAPPRQRVGWLVGWTCTDESARGDTRYLTHMGYSIVSTPSPKRSRFFDRMQTHFTRNAVMGVKPRSAVAVGILTVPTRMARPWARRTTRRCACACGDKRCTEGGEFDSEGENRFFEDTKVPIEGRRQANKS
jgi:hypothetical protein